MGGTVIDIERVPPHAEDTAMILQQAAHGGSPVMIPGAFAMRVSRPPSRSQATAETVRPQGRAAVDDRERLEHEREGGGAPGERMHVRHRTILERLWQRAFRPTDLASQA